MKDVLPPDYTDRPPENLEAVASNLEIIQKVFYSSHLRTNSLTPLLTPSQLLVSKELKEFVSNLIDSVYTVLDTFLGELKFYCDPKTPNLAAFGKCTAG